MPFKINISIKEGKTYKLEAEAPALIQKELGQTVKGEEISPDLAGYELKITGASDKSGFTSLESVEGITLQKVLLQKGKAMKNKPKGESKKPVSTPKGLRLRKTVRGKVISEAISQINTQVIKEGSKPLSEVFPDQNKAPEPEPKGPEEPKPEEAAPAEEATPKEESKPEAPTEEKKEEEEPAQEKAEEKTEPAKEETAPENEAPKESEASKEEKANPDEEPKSA